MKRKTVILIFLIAMLFTTFTTRPAVKPVMAQAPEFKLGNEMLLERYLYLLEGKRVGLITNQSGVNSKGQSLIDILAAQKSFTLTALYAPEHGIDGQAKAGEYVESTVHPALGIPVCSLYGATRKPTAAMLSNVDVLLFDLQDIGARSYTYISTMNYAMQAAKENGKLFIVLDRPNPLGGKIVDGPVLEDGYQTFVGVDILPMTHGMTIGELALYFNRKIGANLKVIPMQGYTRSMFFQDTGLKWVQTSPNIPDLEAVFGYAATGLGEGTGIYQSDKFRWIGGKNINAETFANLLNKADLPGVKFIPEYKGSAGGVRLQITDYHTFNPARTGIYALAYARQLSNFTVPKSTSTNMVMFDKIMGSNKMGQWLEQKLTPWSIVSKYTPELNKFKAERQKYLIYGDEPYLDVILVFVNGKAVDFDSAPYIDTHNRTMVPLRAISEALGARVDWYDSTRTVTVTKNGQTVIFTIGRTEAVVNGQYRYMDTTPVIKNDRTMLPLRYVGEYLGGRVDWDEDKRIVTVNQ